jgi:4-aminobutyrate aminotransferase-like enzyme/Ser/Thr protein kinase RdoA (MazF antagonist)
MPSPISHDPPALSETEIISLAQTLYGLSVTSIHPLPGERDQNARLRCVDEQNYVLKISSDLEEEVVLDLQNSALTHLASHAPELQVPRIISTSTGKLIGKVQTGNENSYNVRLFSYLPGKTLARVKPHAPALLYELGNVLGRLDSALQDFSHPAARRQLRWDLAQANWINGYLAHIVDPEKQKLVERLFALHTTQVEPCVSTLRRSVIHNDANDYNVLLTPAGKLALLDFGDLLYSYTVNELAIACAYAMLDKPDPLAAATQLVAGYHAAHPLAAGELAVLFPLICARLCVSVTNSAYQRQAQPDNAYLLISERPAWNLLERLDGVAPELVHYRFRAACGLAACPQTPGLERWLREHQQQFAALIDPDPRTARKVVFDLSVSSAEVGNPEEWQHTNRFSRRLFERMRDEQVQLGIGLYNEVRPWYGGQQFDLAGNDRPEARTVHIGLDLYAEAGTPVYAPLDGTIYSFANNAEAFDYGPTIFLKHRVDDGNLNFYTLYGHLSEDSLSGIYEGMPVKAGMQIASIGNYPTNGNWPPHLHFQIISDILGAIENFPGVARPSERALWLSISPDPNLIAGIPELPAANEASSADLLARRTRHVGKSLSISYEQPLQIVRGWRQYLYDENGQAYLDLVNNVCHVGHSHPRVVQAGQQQMAVLNTNTRYLHENLVRYAERLCATLPPQLSVCYLVCSGSEANELALRLARAHTGRKDIITVDVAYHGNTQALIEISPYKHNGPGGTGAPPYVHTAMMPDSYRGPYRGQGAGRKYGLEVAKIVEQHPEQIAGFICESLLGCGGQIVLPEGYLATAYQAVREAGGVCIADEVQVGFGRVGSHFWGFELQGVVPDIVTLGKPIGNGHPLAAVITTPEIAASFNNGMEYFNTFGGNPVSCAIGLAVLDVIEQEGLQAHAQELGSYLLEQLTALAQMYPLLGDVRGSGLFIGVELVDDRETLSPADKQASYIINRMRDCGILLSTDGPLHNVLKFKPPLVITHEDADRFVVVLERILAEDEAQPKRQA